VLARQDGYGPSALALNDAVVAYVSACSARRVSSSKTRADRQRLFQGRRQLPGGGRVSIYAAMFSAISRRGTGDSYLPTGLFFAIILSKLLIVPSRACLYLPCFRRLNVTTAYEI
jgi:hypothetical protein